MSGLCKAVILFMLYYLFCFVGSFVFFPFLQALVFVGHGTQYAAQSKFLWVYSPVVMLMIPHTLKT